ncbi:hypothetical protein ALDI51_25980 [Alicycliphilus denitrificans]|jgi:uncharacterized protein YndB with AHSA1/START domain|uniref:SRPBCC domain-containing protein n=1 Tax=Alicycliphilus denitrificans TaxID=179636 RepID=UPI00095F2FFB|nr:SRPBCC domain-containing protein [Alicycliphilus denitrificans]MBN9572826.1 SRPBCC domain-containing protein [Alicycliphilus denitrificans]OJW91051.1 MAG: polyketide cyclase [Alicycliphilus sp. 69-12]BCN39279.1 hypothetical protein ALDI51_25980 [Alicycliphilus denitrificans]
MSPAVSDEIRTLCTTRVLAASPAAVFGAIADWRLISRWWGPAGFHSTFHTFDFRPGGRWIHTLHGPDGTDYANECRFTEIVAGQRVVIEHTSAPWFELELTLAPQDGGTRIGWRQTFADAETCARLAPVCVPGNEQNLDRLAAVLADLAARR